MSFRILFDGETMPGIARMDAINNMVSQLGLGLAQAEALFGGKTTILKRGLNGAQLAQYMERLTAAGLRVRGEPEDGAPAVPVSAPARPSVSPQVIPAPAPAPLAVVAEEIVCPQCQERQPKRTLCRSCALDIPRYLAMEQSRQNERKEEANAARAAARAARDQQRRPQLYEDEERPSLLGFSFAGRLRRSTYLVAACLQFVVAAVVLNVLIGAVGIFGNSAQIALAIVVALALFPMMLWGLRIGVLRCHDLGWSGWFMLLMFLPLANVVLSLLLLFKPGQQDDNDYGAVPARTPWLYVIGVFIMTGIILAITSVVLDKTAASSRAGDRPAELTER